MISTIAVTLLSACLALQATISPACAEEPAEDALLRGHLWSEVTSLPRAERPTVGLVLSAGGVRGLAHVGVIRVLERAGFPVDVIAGSSMGAVVGALYASGLPISRIWALGNALSLSSGNNLNKVRLIELLLRDRLLSTENTEKLLRSEIGDKYFYELPKPFACVAMDIKTGEPIIFREGSVAPAVRASMNVPGIFSPVQYRQRYLVDGGVVDYIPIDAAKLLGAEWILASVTEGDYTRTLPSNVFTALDQVIDIRGALLSREQRKQADMVVEPAVGDILFQQTERSEEAMDKGVLAMKNKLPETEENYILAAMPRLMRRWGASQ